MKRLLLSIAAVVAVAAVCMGQINEARAVANVQLTQTIAPGVLSVSVLNASEVVVASPSCRHDCAIGNGKLSADGIYWGIGGKFPAYLCR